MLLMIETHFKVLLMYISLGWLQLGSTKVLFFFKIISIALYRSLSASAQKLAHHLDHPLRPCIFVGDTDSL